MWGGSHTFWRVMTTPQGTGAPINLCPETETDPMAFLKDTRGAFLMNGICRRAGMPQRLQMRDEALKGLCSKQGRALKGGTCKCMSMQE